MLQSRESEGDTAMLQLRLANGLPVQSFFSLNAGDEDRFEIQGQAGKLAVDRHHSLNIEFSDLVRAHSRFQRLRQGLHSLVLSPYLLDSALAPGRRPSYEAARAHFVSAVQFKHQLKPDFVDGYRSLAVVEAAEEAARTGRVVSLPDVPDEDFAR